MMMRILFVLFFFNKLFNFFIYMIIINVDNICKINVFYIYIKGIKYEMIIILSKIIVMFIIVVGINCYLIFCDSFVFYMCCSFKFNFYKIILCVYIKFCFLCF